MKTSTIAPAEPLLATESLDAVYAGDDADWDPGAGTSAGDAFDQWKQPVRCATTADIAIATALNAGDSIDDVTLAAGDRVLVKDQADASENGIYVAGASPARAPDLDADGEIMGALVYVIAGTAGAGTIWRNTNTTAPAVDTDDITWAELDTGSIPAGTYLTAGTGEAHVLNSHGVLGATETLDLATGNVHTGTLDADCTFTLSGFTAGSRRIMQVVLTEDGTGGWEPTFTDVVWVGGATPTHDTTAGTDTEYILWSDDGGTTIKGGMVGGAGGGGTPATTVESETTWNITPAVGTDTEYARQDHTHGTPPEPASGGVGPLLIEDTPAGSPLVFADLLQNEEGTDLLYADAV